MLIHIYKNKFMI